MFLRIVKDSFTRQPRRKALTALALALGTAMATATLSVALDVGDRMSREFRSLGANLLVTPRADTLPLRVGGMDYRPVNVGSYLSESELGKLKTIFWRNNIVGFAPLLDVPVALQRIGPDSQNSPVFTTLLGTWFQHDVPIPGNGGVFRTGVASTNGWWHVDGRWFADDAPEGVVGASLAKKLNIHVGERLHLSAGERSKSLLVVGILTTGESEDEGVVAPLAIAQDLSNRAGQYRRLVVSALTKPEDGFSQRDRSAMTPAEYDRWYCSPYISSISHQLQEKLAGIEVHPIRRVAEAEGRILSRVSVLMWLVTLAALVAAAVAVGGTAGTSVLERQSEVGLMKALGASRTFVAVLFLGEQWLLAFLGGTAGYFVGMGLAEILGTHLFGVSPDLRWILLPIVLGVAAGIATLGSVLSLRALSRLDPAPVLRGE